MSSAPFAWQLFQNFGSNQGKKKGSIVIFSSFKKLCGFLELKLQIRTDQVTFFPEHA